MCMRLSEYLYEDDVGVGQGQRDMEESEDIKEGFQDECEGEGEGQ